MLYSELCGQSEISRESIESYDRESRASIARLIIFEKARQTDAYSHRNSHLPMMTMREKNSRLAKHTCNLNGVYRSTCVF